MKRSIFICFFVFLITLPQEPSAQVSQTCLNRCIGAYNTAYGAALDQHRASVEQMLWDITNVIGSAWSSLWTDVWQGLFASYAVLSSYNDYMMQLYNYESYYYYQVADAADDYNQCIGGCMP